MQLAYFYEAGITATDSIFTLNENSSRHCTQALRMRSGDPLLLTNGQGLLSECTIIAPDKRHTQVKIVNNKQEIRPVRRFSIAIGMLKNSSRMEWFLEKATELGIDNIYPLLTEHTEKQNFRMERMNNIIEAAMIQSQQCFLPNLHDPMNLTHFLQTVNAEQKFIAHCEEDSNKLLLSRHHITNNSLVLIGPEGDFSTDEILLAQKQGYTPISLGNTRLRTETAGVAAAVMLALH